MRPERPQRSGPNVSISEFEERYKRYAVFQPVAHQPQEVANSQQDHNVETE